MSAAAGIAEQVVRRRYAVLALLCFLLYLPGFFTIPPLDRDESRFAQASKQMIESGDYVDIRFQDVPRHKKPIGIYWLQSASATVSTATDSIWAYRIPSLLGMITAVLLTAWFGTRLAGPQAGFIAGLIMATALMASLEARMAKTDAVLLAATTAAQIGLARFYLQPRRAWADDWPWFLLLWGGVGIGGLIKGPVTLMVVAATVIVVSVWDRSAAWVRGARPFLGILFALLIVAPWLVAIGIETDGAFFAESVGQDMGGKLLQGQESHGSPPGYYFLTFWLSFWPFSLLAALAVPWVIARRNEPHIRFLIAWVVPTWLIFEIIATKLPHYVLPVFPAVALLAALALKDGLVWPKATWGKVALILAIALWGVITLAFGGVIAAFPVVMGEAVSPLAVFAGLAGIAGALTGALFLWRGRTGRALGSFFAGALVAYSLTFGLIFPSTERFWISPRLAAAYEANRPCQTSVLASSGYSEPSLVFLTATDTKVGIDGAGAVRHLMSDPVCALAAVTQKQKDAFLEAAEARSLPVEALAVVEGLNYSKGDDLTITLYRVVTPEGAL